MIDLHVHTSFCDGRDVPEDIVLEAIKKDIDTLGFSGHSYTFFDESYCMSKENTEKYFSEITHLKEKYQDKIKILCGMELDYYADFVPKGYDYIIGSVHYLKLGDDYVPVDHNTETLAMAVERYFDGDIYSLCEEYYKTVGNLLEKTNATIIAHIDLISKFNEKSPMFDVKNERYVAAYRAAVDQLLQYGIPFEINTGAISRGYRTSPYPDMDILKYIIENGGKVILSSDSHKKETLCYKFEEYQSIINIQKL